MPSSDGKRRICLVTAEFHGLFKNGGIGTANTGLALTLAEAGHDVTVAYVDAGLVDFDERLAAAADTIAHWEKRGVKLEFVPRNPALRAGHEDHVAASYTVLQYLRGRGFEVVFFNECGGQGYFPLLAKKAGLFPDAPRMVVVTHGASAWVLELNQQLYWSLHPVSVDFLERRSVELADDLVSPSHYLVGWMRDKGWRLPASTRVIQNALPVEPGARRAAASVEEVVFFGRLEARKGVELFLAAYSKLCATRDMSRLKVTFLGKFSRIEGVHSGVHVLERSRAWPAPPTLITELGQEEALKYLSRPGVLAVMPSRAENSPCVVAECLIAGVPFVATDSGGTAELIAPADRARTLSANTPDSLAEKIAAALDAGAPTASLAVSQAQSRQSWLDLLAEAAPPAKPAAPPRPVSLCLAVSVPPTSEAWRAFLAQDFAEIVVVSPDARVALPEDRRIRRIVEPGLPVAAARNLAAAQAQGPWLMFADERDVVLKPEALNGFLAAAGGLEADVVACPGLEFAHAGAPRDGWDNFIGLLPQGANLTLAAFENCLGDGCFLIDRGRFQSVGGFAADASAALRDRLLLTEAALAGATLEIAAAPLFWRHEAPAATLAFSEDSADQRRLLQAFSPHRAALLAPALESLAAASPRARERVSAALSGLGAVARELALKLSRMSQRDSLEQNRPFLDYCLARGRHREAYAFAQWLDDPELLTLARAGAEAAAEKAALGAVRQPAALKTRVVSLLRIAADRARSVAGLEAGELSSDGGVAIVHPLRGVAVVKAANVCPPGARRLLAKVSASAATQVALVACDRFALLRLDGDGLSGEERFVWTGWRAPGELALELTPPFEECADVLLLARGPRATVSWSGLDAEVAVFDFTTASAVALEPGVTPLPRRMLANAELLTPAADFPGRYFLAGPPATHHPLVGRPALVKLNHAIFQGATGLRASFGLEHEQSRPVEFALWARRAERGARDVAALGDSPFFSGWQPVRSAFREHQAEIVFPEPLRQPHDLYLATRVVDFPDTNYCHAVWYDILVIESSKRAA